MYGILTVGFSAAGVSRGRVYTRPRIRKANPPRELIVVQLEGGVILSVAAFQAERRAWPDRS